MERHGDLRASRPKNEVLPVLIRRESAEKRLSSGEYSDGDTTYCVDVVESLCPECGADIESRGEYMIDSRGSAMDALASALLSPGVICTISEPKTAEPGVGSPGEADSSDSSWCTTMVMGVCAAGRLTRGPVSGGCSCSNSSTKRLWEGKMCRLLREGAVSPKRAGALCGNKGVWGDGKDLTAVRTTASSTLPIIPVSTEPALRSEEGCDGT